MKKCPYCGAEMPDEMNFCLTCMHKLNSETELTVAEAKTRKRWVAVSGFAGLLVAVIALVLLWSPLRSGNAGQAANGDVAPTTSTIISTTSEAAGGRTTAFTTTTAPGTANADNTPTTASTAATGVTTNTDTPKPSTTSASKPTTTTKPAISPDDEFRANVLTANEKLYTWLPLYQMTFEPLSGNRTRCVFSSLNAIVDFAHDGSWFKIAMDEREPLLYYQMCQFATVVVKAYSKNYDNRELYAFLNADEESKSGSFDGYTCKLTVNSRIYPGSGGLTYESISIVFEATKN